MFKSTFDKTLENATSHLHLEPDWASMITLCDLVRQNEIPPKNAIASIKKKMFHQNPHTSFYALLALESIVKNCGPPVHEEISNKANCELFAQLINTTQHENVKNKMLELIQTWAHAFRTNHKHRAIKDTMNILKCEGHKFPELKVSDAMFTADVAPEWADGDVCHRCRVTFSLTQRKHHCRNCGQVFCHQCSSKTSRIPKYGIEKEVRVCDGCSIVLQNLSSCTPAKKVDDDLPEEYLKSSLAQQPQVPPTKSDQEIQEEEELQLALALSQSEAEQKPKSTNWHLQSTTHGIVSDQSDTSKIPEEQSNPELSRYLNRDFWEQKSQQPKRVQQQQEALKESPLSPTAPSPMSSITGVPIKTTINDPEMEEFVGLMRSQLDIFISRMKSSSVRGRNISNDTSIQTLFLNISSLHSRLLTYIKELDDKRMWYESLQDKLGQIKDSRAALDVLRQEHQEKLRRIAEEQERQRQQQMALKLDMMRKKKQEYLQYQRQLALQRIQEQERNMQIHQEQQKAMYRMGGPNFGYHQTHPIGTTALVQSGQFGNLDQHNISNDPITQTAIPSFGIMAQSNQPSQFQNYAAGYAYQFENTVNNPALRVAEFNAPAGIGNLNATQMGLNFNMPAHIPVSVVNNNISTNEVVHSTLEANNKQTQAQKVLITQQPSPETAELTSNLQPQSKKEGTEVGELINFD